jgi:Macrocin-O-methyltransferase (TylF)
MPTRAKYLNDPGYERAFERAFGTTPDKPYLEIFIPKKEITKELTRAIMRPVWDMEIKHIWQEIVDDMSRRGIKGDLLEFGVYVGQSFRTLIDLFAGKNLIDRFYGFDSFQGLPKPDVDKDPSTWAVGAFSATKADAWARISRGLSDTSKIELVEGWFSDTLALYRDKIKNIAFIRIDCDLYQSTVDVFEFADGRIVDGGILYFDDWTHDHRTGETRAFFEFAEKTASYYRFEKIVTVSDGGFAVRVKLI